LAARGPVACLAAEVLGVDGFDDCLKDGRANTKGTRQHVEVVFEGVTHYDDGAVSKFGLGGIDVPEEDAVEHVAGVGLVHEAGLAEAVAEENVSGGFYTVD